MDSSHVTNSPDLDKGWLNCKGSMEHNPVEPYRRQVCTDTKNLLHGSNWTVFETDYNVRMPLGITCV